MAIAIELTNKTPKQILAEISSAIEADSEFAKTLQEHIPVDQTTGDIALDLVRLTLLLETIIGAAPMGGGLGGTYGYGCYFENATFAMHPYCWCEEVSCPWCMPCTCVEEYKYKNKVIDFDTWYDARKGLDLNWNEDAPDYSAKTVVYCQRHRPVDPVDSAPLFWHKSQGVQISWYKYIGRDMEVTVPQSTNWADVYAECVRSLTTEPYTFDPVWPPTDTVSNEEKTHDPGK